MKGSSSSLLLALTASLAAALQVTPVFTSYQVNQSECYRQPILLSLPGNRLVALVEGRSGISWCAGTDWPVAPSFPIVSRASNDGGATWGDIATVLPPANLDFLTSVFDPRTNKLHLMVQLGDDGIVYTTSTDFGRSWSPAVPIFVAGTFASIIPGVGHGIVIDPKYCIDPSCGGTAGRLIMSFACTLAGPVSNDTYCVYCRTCLLTSDNGGGSWALSAVSNHTGSREAALAQLNSADYFTTGAVVYVSERNLGPTPGSRMHAVSLNGGSTFDARYYGVDASLPDVLTANWTGVVSGLTRVSSPIGVSADRLFFSAPNAGRTNLSVYISSGLGPQFTWAPSTLPPIWPGDAAYSDALQINATHVGVLFECGSGGDFAAEIGFAAVPISML